MPDRDERRKPHFILEGNAHTERFQAPPRRGGSQSPGPAKRSEHGAKLREQLERLQPSFAQARTKQESAGLAEEGIGLQIEFGSFPDIELAFESLAREASGIELLNVRHDSDRTFATVFVPDRKLRIFENLVRAYLDESKDGAHGPRNHKLLNSISEIRTATVEALWTDEPAVLPTTEEERLWWEIWLPVRGDRAAIRDEFISLAEDRGFVLAPGALQFPERTVLLAQGSTAKLKESMMTLNHIAELRRAKDTAEFFDSLPLDEQSQWLRDLESRLTVSAEGEGAPRVCLLDTGVNRGHPLVSRALALADLHSVEPGWGTNDDDGHGTEMAGLALIGDLSDALAADSVIAIGHRLESVKLLPYGGANCGDAGHHGHLTVEAVARPEISAPRRERLFSMAVTARDNRDRGQPSAWSAAVDGLAADVGGQGETSRLFVISAGNVSDPNAWAEYPESNVTDGIHDPGQSWNALTVGAATYLAQITDPDAANLEPVAAAGGLSPFSTTSVSWQKHWPLKPDVVFEGGNVAEDDLGAVALPSLSLLTTDSKPAERLFTTTNATSAATALAARMAAQLMGEYPALWPETIRALIVHSAEWTATMRQTFLPSDRDPSMSDMARLVRCCGFGIPDLERAMWSVDNSLTLVCQDRLFPFERVGTQTPKYRNMNLHRLPWPLAQLEELGATPVTMRVTLSYFIEPNPAARGFKTRYRYESHGLRFDVKRPVETEAEFRARMNAAARDGERHTSTGTSDSDWMIGTQNRHRGSVHSDIWVGTAADLASRGVIGITPALGWWKSRPRLKRYDQTASYALVVSIHAPEVDVDLYTAVANQITAPVTVRA